MVGGIIQGHGLEGIEQLILNQAKQQGGRVLRKTALLRKPLADLPAFVVPADLCRSVGASLDLRGLGEGERGPHTGSGLHVHRALV